MVRWAQWVSLQRVGTGRGVGGKEGAGKTASGRVAAGKSRQGDGGYEFLVWRQLLKSSQNIWTFQEILSVLMISGTREHFVFM